MIEPAGDDEARGQLIKLAGDLRYLAGAQSKPIEVVLAEARTKFEMLAGQADRDDEPFTRITAEELARAKFDMTYLVEGVLVKDQPAGLVGPKKSLKTNISLDLAVSLATGGRFLGYFNVPEPRRMAVMSGESGMATIQETAQRVCLAAGQMLEETGIIFSDTLPRFGDMLNLSAFRRFLERDAIEVAIVDPAYLCLPADVNAANLFDVGRVLRNVNEVCQEAGTTLVLAHHLKKGIANPYAPGQLEDIGWAGFQEFFRQWMLVNRREPYDPGTGMHRLWFSTGGSAGHSCLLGLDIFEGIFDPTGSTPRVWDVTVLKASEVIRKSADRREEAKEEAENARAQAKLERDMRRLSVVLLERPDGDTVTALTNAAGLSRERGRAALDAMVELAQIVACQVTKGNNRKLDGYQLVSNDEHRDQRDGTNGTS